MSTGFRCLSCASIFRWWSLFGPSRAYAVDGTLKSKNLSVWVFCFNFIPLPPTQRVLKCSKDRSFLHTASPFDCHGFVVYSLFACIEEVGLPQNLRVLSTIFLQQHHHHRDECVFLLQGNKRGIVLHVAAIQLCMLCSHNPPCILFFVMLIPCIVTRRFSVTQELFTSLCRHARTVLT